MLQYSFAYGTPELLVDAVLAPSLTARCLRCRRVALILLSVYTPLKAEKPPSTGITTPVTNSEAGESSQRTQPNRSLVSPRRPIGVCPMIVLPRGVQSPVSLSSIK